MWLDYGVSSGKEYNSSDVTRARVCTTIVLKISAAGSKITQFWGGSDITTDTFFAYLKFRCSQAWPLNQVPSYRWVIDAQQNLLTFKLLKIQKCWPKQKIWCIGWKHCI